MTSLHDKKPSNRMMWLLGLLFIIPSLAAVTLFYQPGLIQFGQTNKGHLYSPPLKISNEKQLDNKWWVLIVCQQGCEQYLDKVKRIRMALGRQMYQVNQALINKQDTHPFKKNKRDTKNKWDTHFLEIDLALKPGIYLSDPRGFVMLSYQLTSPSDDIYSDLKHLLKVSSTVSSTASSGLARQAKLDGSTNQSPNKIGKSNVDKS